MTAPRIVPLSAEDAAKTAEQVQIDPAKAAFSIYRVLLHQPGFAKQVNDMAETLMTTCRLEPRLRELIIMRIGWVKKGVYEWAQHWWIANQLGVPERDLLAVRDWQAHDHWSPVDRAVLRATDETLEHGTISQPTWEDCAVHFPTDRDRIELVATIGNWKMMSEVLTSLAVPLDDGFSPWPPDGMGPA